MNQSYKKRSSFLCHWCDYLTCKARKNGKKKKCKWYLKNAKKYGNKRLDKEVLSDG